MNDLYSEQLTDYDLRDSFRKLNLPKPRTEVVFIVILIFTNDCN